MSDSRENQVLSIAAILQRADQLLPEYRRAVADMPRETEFKGIGASGMFFFFAAVHPFAPKQILESGRMRGESTLALVRCFPEAHIISVEFDRHSKHAAIAEAKLKQYANVDLLYGDGRDILPPRLQDGDAVLIDGPKEFRALKLALQLLRTGKPCAVFIHDFFQNEPAREFVERYWPGAFFSDDPAFSARFSALDSEIDPTHGREWKHSAAPFVCLPGGLPAPYWVLLFRVIMARAQAIAASKIARFFSPRRNQVEGS
jgi:predicted O-methyltransferase YrrM